MGLPTLPLFPAAKTALRNIISILRVGRKVSHTSVQLLVLCFLPVPGKKPIILSLICPSSILFSHQVLFFLFLLPLHQ